MKKIVDIICLLSIVIGSISAQSSQVRKIESFNGVSVFGSVDLMLLKGKSDSLRIVCDGILLDKVHVTNEKGMLKISATDKLFSKYRNIEIYVAFNELTKIEANAGAYIRCKEPVITDSLIVNAGTGSSIMLVVSVNHLNSSIGKGATVSLEGLSKSIFVSAGSGGILNAYDLKSEAVTAKASMGGIVKIGVTDMLDASVSMGGSVSYRGTPKSKKEHKTFGGSIDQVVE
jgi:hypothetical protein